ncbi:hypothetical protein BHM03_00032711 [Ensete ventricosum]|nr:hypothetical protein BHM03_00032711 [Ensete ventricosum]
MRCKTRLFLPTETKHLRRCQRRVAGRRRGREGRRRVEEVAAALFASGAQQLQESSFLHVVESLLFFLHGKHLSRSDSGEGRGRRESSSAVKSSGVPPYLFTPPHARTEHHQQRVLFGSGKGRGGGGGGGLSRSREVVSMISALLYLPLPVLRPWMGERRGGIRRMCAGSCCCCWRRTLIAVPRAASGSVQFQSVKTATPSPIESETVPRLDDSFKNNQEAYRPKSAPCLAFGTCFQPKLHSPTLISFTLLPPPPRCFFRFLFHFRRQNSRALGAAGVRGSQCTPAGILAFERSYRC